MKKQNRSSLFFLALAASLALSITHAQAGSFTISTTSTSGQTLNNGQTGTVTSTGSLTVSGTAVAISGTSTASSNLITVNNSGKIVSTTGRAIRDQSGASNSLINNAAGAVIQSSGNDTIALNVNGSAATSASVMDIENKGTIQSLDAGGSGTTTPSAKGNQAINLSVATGATVVRNFSTGVISATGGDAVRPGLDGSVYNDGFIYSNAYQGSGSDGIDAQTNTGVTIVNGATTESGNNTAAMYQGAFTTTPAGVATPVAPTESTIEGGRHGITGGNTGTNTSGPYADSANPNDPGYFTLSVTNNGGAVIKGQNGSGINIDGFGYYSATGKQNITNELVTVKNYGTIIGNGVTGDGDGVDVDGAVNLDNYGKIQSLNSAGGDVSEGVTVGGGTIVNEAGATIEGGTTSGGIGRGITLAGVDKDSTSAGNPIPIQSVYGYYANPLNPTQAINPSITNYGTIKGDTESGIAVLGTTGGGATVTITNAGLVEGKNSGVSEDVDIAGTTTLNGQSLNQAAIELDDTGNNYVLNNSGTITQDTAGEKAVAMHGKSNAFTVTGGSAHVNGDITGDTAADSTLTINPGTGGTFTYSNAISNFTVQVNADGGKGTVKLAGASDDHGATTVNAGTLDVSGSIANSATAVKNSALFMGSGSAGATSVASGGVVQAGDASTSLGGTQGASSNFQFSLAGLSLDGGSTMSFTLYSGAAGGTLAHPDGGTEFNLGTGALAAGADVTADSILINLNDSAAKGTQSNPNVYQLAVFGSESIALADFQVENLSAQSGISYTLSYDSIGGGQEALDLEVTPEPGTWALLLAGTGMLAFVVRRRQTQA